MLRSLILVLALLALAPSAEAMTAYCTVSQPSTDGFTYAGTADLPITPCAAIPTGSLIVVATDYFDDGTTITNITTGGQTWTAGTNFQLASTTTRLFWTIFNGTWAADPVFDEAFNFNVSFTGMMEVYAPCTGGTISSTPDVAESLSYSASATIPITGQTPTAGASTVTIAMWLAQGSVTFSGLTAGWTNRNGGGAQLRNTYTGPVTFAIADKIQSSASATGNATNTQDTAIFTHTRMITFKETGCSGGGGGGGRKNPLNRPLNLPLGGPL